MGGPHLFFLAAFQQSVCSPASDIRFPQVVSCSVPMLPGCWARGRTHSPGRVVWSRSGERCGVVSSVGQEEQGLSIKQRQHKSGRLIITELCVQKDLAFSRRSRVILPTYVGQGQTMLRHGHNHRHLLGVQFILTLFPVTCAFPS